MIDGSNARPLYLASASPRRRELLQQIGVRFECLSVDIDEEVRPDEPASDYVVRLALAKARHAATVLPANALVLGADTTVVCDGAIFGKPRDAADGVEMLMRLAGRTHQVMTAVALGTDDRWRHCLVTTEVTFLPLHRAECERYWSTGEPADKAGGYAIQGLAAVFVSGIAGSYSAVVGLPLAETAELLREFEVEYWTQEVSGGA